jgi:cobalt/nickel transport system permease protein
MGAADWAEIGRMDELGRMDTPVHRLDARAKAVVTLGFIVVVMSFPRREISALTPLALYPVVLMSLGGVPVRHILRKILVAAPFALVIGIFNPLMDRQPVAALGPWVITGGWISFASIILRFVLTVGAALILVACTGIHRLCGGLERMGCPRVFAVQLVFLYRYLFVVAGDAARMTRSVRMRSAGRRSLGLRTYGSLVGHLLLRAMDRAQRIYRAMVARGFEGEVRALRPSRLGWREVAFVAGWSVFFAGARMWNVAEHVGRWLTGSGV